MMVRLVVALEVEISPKARLLLITCIPLCGRSLGKSRLPEDSPSQP